MLNAVRLTSMSILLLFLSSSALSEELIQREEHQFLISPLLKVPLFGFSIESTNADENGEDDSDIDYKPAISPEFGLALTVDDFTASMTFPMSQDADEQRKDGRSTYRDYKFDYMKNYFGFDVGFQQYKGFYIDDSNKDESHVHEQRPDMGKSGYYANLFFLPMGDRLAPFNKRLSNSGGKETLSWSPVIQTSYENVDITSGEAIIPQAKFALFGKDASFQQGNFRNIGLAGGAAMAYTKEKFQFFGLMTLGAAHQYQRYLSNGIDEKRETNAERLSMRLGFNGFTGVWMYGFNMMYDQSSIPLRSIDIKSEVGVFTIFVSRNIQEFIKF